MKFLSRCDEVIFMDEGSVVDQGIHDVLLDRNERYSHLIKTFLQDDSDNAASCETDGSSLDNGFKTNRLELV